MKKKVAKNSDKVASIKKTKKAPAKKQGEVEVAKATIYAILHLNNELKGNKEKIANELGVSMEAVDSVLKQKGSSTNLIKKLMTSKSNGITVMTQAAGEQIDEMKKKGKMKKSRDYSNIVFKPNG